MATSKLVIGTEVEVRFTSVLSRGKAFICFAEGEDKPIILAKSIAAEDGYVHRSQLTGKTFKVKPTQPSNGSMPGFLAEVSLGLASLDNYSDLVKVMNLNKIYTEITNYKRAALQMAEEA